MARTSKARRPTRSLWKRNHYTTIQKHEVFTWHSLHNMSLKNIKRKFNEVFKMDVASGTLAGWYNDAMKKRFKDTAIDRLNVTDVRYYLKQRPDIVVDLENILARRCNAVERTGITYNWKIAQMLGIHIFHQLVKTQLYTPQGQRKQQNMPLPDELVSNVKVSRYMTESSKITEYYKSEKRIHNSTKDDKNKCTLCPRKFADNINLTLHIYYHECKKDKALVTVNHEEELSDGEELSDEEVDVSTISVFRFKASPGWLSNFMKRNDVAFLKIKGEKGSADYEAVKKWVDEWIFNIS